MRRVAVLVFLVVLPGTAAAEGEGNTSALGVRRVPRLLAAAVTEQIGDWRSVGGDFSNRPTPAQQQRRTDSLRNGAWIGAAVGAGVGFGVGAAALILFQLPR